MQLLKHTVSPKPFVLAPVSLGTLLLVEFPNRRKGAGAGATAHYRGLSPTRQSTLV
jgi:hypothetical protein